jgi:hypothetical protein
MKAEVLALGLFLVGLSVIPFFYGYSVTVSPNEYDMGYSSQTGNVAFQSYASGGLLLAIGLAICGEGIGMNGKKQRSPEDDTEPPKRF